MQLPVNPRLGALQLCHGRQDTPPYRLAIRVALPAHSLGKPPGFGRGIIAVVTNERIGGAVALQVIENAPA